MAYDRIKRLLARAPRPPGVEPDQAVMARFVDAMDQDFATPDAVAGLFDAIAEANRLLDLGQDQPALVAAIHEVASVLGLEIEADRARRHRRAGYRIGDGVRVAAGSPGEVVSRLLELRARARNDRDFARSDLIRDRLSDVGVLVEDTSDGARWLRR